METNRHSIRRKLVGQGLRITALALAILMTGTLIFDTLGKRQALIDTAYVDAEIIGRNSTAAILFGDKNDAGEVLATLSANKQVLQAALFLPDGSMLAGYHSALGAKCGRINADHYSQNHRMQFDLCSMIHYHPVDLNGEQIGTIAIEYSLSPLFTGIAFDLLFGVLAILVTLAVSLPVWRRFAIHLTAPLFHLSRLTQRVESEQDFRLRATEISDDEVGTLALSFNSMMAQLQRHDLRLREELDQRRSAETRLNQLAYYDNVTPLHNRHYFKEQLEILVDDAVRNDRNSAVLFIDLDSFKKVNDTLGHDAGDELLHQVATRIQSGVRSNDIACRLGGDEFAIIIRHNATRDLVERLAERLLELIAQPCELYGKRVFVTASIGACLCPEQARDKETLVKYADIAMYQAKERGKNGYCFYQTSSAERIDTHVTLENALRDALSEGQLHLHYQPLFRAKERTLTRFEALLRWRHPELGNITPDQFIPIAESTDLILPIGEWVLTQACCQLVEWRKTDPDLRLSINLSPQQLKNEQAIERLIAILKSYPLPARSIELELIESSLLELTPSIRMRMQTLLEAGFLLAIDDFGTGYSSLAYLHELPFTHLKIDKQFIATLDQKTNGRALIQAIVSIGSALNIRVTAEGVEQEAQADILAELGCDYLQGYFLSMPLPVDEAHKLVAGRATIA